MIINYLGGHFFKIQSGNFVIGVNPPEDLSKTKGSKFGADIAFSSLKHPDFNGVDNLFYGEKKPFLISGPGEYELSGLFAKGILVKTNIEGKEYFNTMYKVIFDDISLCFFGGLSNKKEISTEAIESIGSVDVLFTPIGGGKFLSTEEAYKLSMELGAKIIIPCNFDKKSLEEFFKEGGNDSVSLQEKLVIKKKDINEKEGEIIALKE